MTFYKLYSWMFGLATGNELIILAIIHTYTELAGGYSGGMEPLMEATGLARSRVYEAIGKLKAKNLITCTVESKGRVHATYASIINRPASGTVNEPTVPPTVPNTGLNRPASGTLLDNNRYIEHPPISPQGGRTRRRRQTRANNIIHGNEDYSMESLERSGVIWDSINEIRID